MRIVSSTRAIFHSVASPITLFPRPRRRAHRTPIHHTSQSFPPQATAGFGIPEPSMRARILVPNTPTMQTPPSGAFIGEAIGPRPTCTSGVTCSGVKVRCLSGGIPSMLSGKARRSMQRERRRSRLPFLSWPHRQIMEINYYYGPPVKTPLSLILSLSPVTTSTTWGQRPRDIGGSAIECARPSRGCCDAMNIPQRKGAVPIQAESFTWPAVSSTSLRSRGS
ncbi:hypothetical protein GGR50DRAFT_627807 [Xylaria sp. CBS 124048]|nr:hypothetical protein GGR50DRAFT_627807 [Xylaria sp. CBS 124048]